METEAIKNKTQSDKKGKVLKNVAVAGAAAVAGAGAVYGAETILDSDPVVDSAHGTTPEENPTQQEQQEQAQQEQQAQQPQHTENVAPSQSQHQNGGQTDAPAPQGNEVNTNSGGTASTGGGQTGSTQQGGEGSVIDNVNPNGYIEQLQFLGKTTIGDLQTMMTENRDLAFKLAERTLAGVELDLVSSSVGLRFLCRAELLNKSYSKEQILDFITLTVKNPKSAGRQMEHLLKVYEECKGE